MGIEIEQRMSEEKIKTTTELLQALREANNVAAVEAAIAEFEAIYGNQLRWVPLGGRQNNRGTVEVAADPGRSLVERLTNGMDAVLEMEYDRHNGIPNCWSPKDAAIAWLNVPEGGLSEMSPTQRRKIAQRVMIKVISGEGRDSRIVEVRDRGVGLTPEQMPGTILSLNESNKAQKHYLAGAYGQGGSSTFAVSKHTLIASRYGSHPEVGFTIVRYEDLPPEEYKIGRYVYLTFEQSVPTAEIPFEEFPSGSLVKHFGYDLSSYSSSLGPNSLYGLLNQVLFDPILPVWLDSYDVHGYRRVIKGSRNALNGAVDEGDEERRGPNLAYRVPLFQTTLGEFGRIGIEYWVLEQPTSANRQPTKAFVNPSRPIILTVNGQNHAEFSQILVRKYSELPYLTQRLICHIDCNNLTAGAKRALFVSNREDARRGIVYDLIQQEVVRVLKSDDELVRLNNEAREQGRREQDEVAMQQMRTEVARLLRLQGIDVGQGLGATTAGSGANSEHPTRPHTLRQRPQPIELHEPPTYIRILWGEDEVITFHSEQRRYIRIETDANSNYHSLNNPASSRINIIAVGGSGVIFRGSTPLEGGRMRAIFEGISDAKPGATGIIRVELFRPGLPMLTDERPFRVIETPPVRQIARRITLPPFKVEPVDGPEDPRWTQLGWPDNTKIMASSAEQENGTLTIYYSTVFPKYALQRTVFEQRDSTLVDSFAKRYEIWLAVHSLLLYQDQAEASAMDSQRQHGDGDEEIAQSHEREERCRTAMMAVLFAAREVQAATDIADTE